MRGGAVQAVEGEVLVEAGQAQEALQGRLAHLHDVAEAHVVFDEREDLRGLFVGEAQAREDGFGDADADLDVAVEADAVVRVVWGRAGGRWRACRCRAAALPTRVWARRRAGAFRAAAWCGPRRRPRGGTAGGCSTPCMRVTSGRTARAGRWRRAARRRGARGLR